MAGRLECPLRADCVEKGRVAARCLLTAEMKLPAGPRKAAGGASFDSIARSVRNPIPPESREV
ncbi:MAG: hypothetical protein JWQ89_900 [Devosia sp.]|nr:hypothetical protein [Devosia sp.]